VIIKQLLRKGIPLLLIEDFFTESEMKDVRKDLEFYTSQDTDKISVEADTVYSTTWRKNEMYYVDNSTNIVKHSEKIAKGEILAKYVEMNPLNRFLGKSSWIQTLLSIHKEGSYIRSHPDDNTISAMIYLHDEPKNFTGGELLIPELQVKLRCTNNTCILMPGFLDHSVEEMQGEGTRYAIIKFYSSIKPILLTDELRKKNG
jgi:Rps23 Pro-64 3,4-dihydroxylase Tpa1-like proline 4-hydroxylase